MTAPRSSRAIADLSQGLILASVEIAVPPERVFQALTDPREVPRWWGAEGVYRVTEWSCDLRPGGAWQSQGTSADGSTFTVGGEFVEIVPPRLLVHTWKAPWDGGNTTTVRYQLEPTPAGTRVTVRHEGFGDRRDSCSSHTEGWERVLSWLAKHFVPAAAAAQAKQVFLCRLLPPRADFMQTMTPDEIKVMQGHAGYWAGLAQRGVAVAYGPVADPQGGWGVGIIETSSREAMGELERGDPAIQSERGFRYEVLPMPRVLTRP